MTKCFSIGLWCHKIRISGIRSVVLMTYLIALAACSNKKSTTQNLPELSAYIVDSVYLPLSISEGPKGQIKEVGRGKYAPEDWIAYVKRSNGMLYFYDIARSAFLDSIPLAEYWKYYPQFQAVGLDSVYVELENNTIIQIFNKQKKIWDASPATKRINPFASIAALSATPFGIFGDTVICSTTTSEDPQDGIPNIPFLKANHELVFSIAADTVRYMTKFNPNPDYMQKQDYDAMREQLYLNSRQMVYAYTHSDTLVLYDFFSGKSKKVKLVTKNFVPNAPYDHRADTSMLYGITYEMSNARMSCMFYDSTQGRIFQLMHHAGRYIEANGSKNTFQDLAQSLFVLDEGLNQLAEIYIPPRAFGPMHYSFITHKGLYIPAHASKQKYHDKMLFYRITVP